MSSSYYDQAMRLQMLCLGLLMLLAGCSATAPEVSFSQEQLFKGYPCYDYCQEFQLGFERAERRELRDQSTCDFVEEKQNLGCKAFVQEYKAEHEMDMF